MRETCTAASFLLVVATLVATTVVVSSESTSSSSIVCVCRCCYQGSCNSLSNVSWTLDTCSSCSTSLCNAYIASDAVRSKTARIFESLENNVPAAARADLTVDVCEVVTVLETATCTGTQCKRTTSLQAECYNRESPFMKYAILTFTFFLVFGTVFGFVKNYIPALQEFNAKYFNY
mmetsp:Transcript_59378/g.68782  ORF Transcript_59378/g.68782 Transcript_59378/m.68782 type:complete len:176 (-) Transcript_59378:18-545(-)